MPLAGQKRQPLNDADLQLRQGPGSEPVILERFPHDWEQRLNDLPADGGRVFADLMLGMRIHPQGEKMQQIVEVDFPVGLCIGA